MKTRKAIGARVAGACPACGREKTGLVVTVYKNIRRGYIHRRFRCRECAHEWTQRWGGTSGIKDDAVKQLLVGVREAEDALMRLRSAVLAVARSR